MQAEKTPPCSRCSKDNIVFLLTERSSWFQAGGEGLSAPSEFMSFGNSVVTSWEKRASEHSVPASHQSFNELLPPGQPGTMPRALPCSGHVLLAAFQQGTEGKDHSSIAEDGGTTHWDHHFVMLIKN